MSWRDKRSFVPVSEAPEVLRNLAPLRRARAMALLSSLRAEFPSCWYNSGTIEYQEAIEDLLAAGLIEVGIHDGLVGIQLAPSKGNVEQARNEVEV